MEKYGENKVEDGLRLTLNCGHTVSSGCTLLATLADEEEIPTFAENICVVQVLHFPLLDREVISFYRLVECHSKHFHKDNKTFLIL